MPTADLPAGLSLLKLPVDAPVAGRSSAPAGGAGDPQQGPEGGFRTLLSEQINNSNKSALSTDKKEKDTPDTNSTVVLETGNLLPLSPAPPGNLLPLSAAVPEGLASAALAEAPAPAEIRASPFSGSPLPPERQATVEQGGLPTDGHTWIASQLAAAAASRSAAERAALGAPRAAAAKQSAPGAALASSATATTNDDPHGALAAVAARGLPLPGVHSGDAAITLPAEPVRPPGNTLIAHGPALQALPALPEAAARAQPAAAYIHQDQPLPAPLPRTTLEAPETGTLRATAGDASAPQPALAARAGAVQQRLQAVATPSLAVPVAQAGADAGSRLQAGAAAEATAASASASRAAADRVVAASASPGAVTAQPAGGDASSPARAPGADLAAAGVRDAASAAPPVALPPPVPARIDAGSIPADAPSSPPAADSRGAGRSFDAAVAPIVDPDVAGLAAGAAGRADAQWSAAQALEDALSPARADALDAPQRGTSLLTTGLQAFAASPHARSEAALPPAVGLSLQPAAAGFGEDLGQRILWLSGSNLKSVEIQLDPPELGPLQIQVQAHREGTSVHFTTHSAVVREAVEATLPRLREMLEGNGAGTVDVNVAQQQRDAPPGPGESGSRSAATRHAAIGELPTLEATPRPRQGLIDDYA